TVIGKVVNGKKLLQFLNNKIPDLILLDLNMPEMDGIETAKYVKLKYPNLKVLVISLYFDQQIKTILQNIKVEGYISKTSNAKTLIS
ncbi:response regulator transcription factor, partial [Acinetobacter baumannii]